MSQLKVLLVRLAKEMQSELDRVDVLKELKAHTAIVNSDQLMHWRDRVKAMARLAEIEADKGLGS